MVRKALSLSSSEMVPPYNTLSRTTGASAGRIIIGENNVIDGDAPDFVSSCAHRAILFLNALFNTTLLLSELLPEPRTALLGSTCMCFRSFVENTPSVQTNVLPFASFLCTHVSQRHRHTSKIRQSGIRVLCWDNSLIANAIKGSIRGSKI